MDITEDKVDFTILRPVGEPIQTERKPTLTVTETLEAFNRIAGKIKPLTLPRKGQKIFKT